MLKYYFGSILIFTWNKDCIERLITFLLKNYMDKFEFIDYLSLHSKTSKKFFIMHKQEDMKISIYNDVIMVEDEKDKIFIHIDYFDIIRSYAERFEEMRKVYERRGLNEDSITLKSINFKVGYAMKTESMIENMIMKTLNSVIV